MQNDDVAEILTKIKGLVDEAIALVGPTTSAASESEVEDFTDSLNWKPYPSGNGHWVFANALGAENLVQKLRENNGQVQIGKFIYKFSGKGKFISRHQVEKR